ncbi:MAG: radical SAM protein [Thermoplasmata archaeon]|nr:radical SAM protein [Thermoplasmata archaeon]
MPYHALEAYIYLEHDLSACKLCEWQCGVDRLDGEKGVCGLTLPEVAASQLHPAPPASYDAFMTGCSFRCLFCQNWLISTYPTNPDAFKRGIEGYYDPRGWAEMGLAHLNSSYATLMGADRLFFTGGEPTCSLPWVEEVVRVARELDPSVKVNYDTNGYLTKDSLTRVLDFTNSITFDIKAYNDKIFQGLTGAAVEPVLRNAEVIGKHHKAKLWEFRIMVIPGVHEEDIEGLAEFIAGIDPELPVNFLAFRPNFVMEQHPGASKKLMTLCAETANKNGLENVSWSGHPGLKGETPANVKAKAAKMEGLEAVKLLSSYAAEFGCSQPNERNCRGCVKAYECSIKSYIPKRIC